MRAEAGGPSSHAAATLVQLARAVVLQPTLTVIPPAAWEELAAASDFREPPQVDALLASSTGTTVDWSGEGAAGGSSSPPPDHIVFLVRTPTAEQQQQQQQQHGVAARCHLSLVYLSGVSRLCRLARAASGQPCDIPPAALLHLEPHCGATGQPKGTAKYLGAESCWVLAPVLAWLEAKIQAAHKTGLPGAPKKAARVSTLSPRLVRCFKPALPDLPAASESGCMCPAWGLLALSWLAAWPLGAELLVAHMRALEQPPPRAITCASKHQELLLGRCWCPPRYVELLCQQLQPAQWQRLLQDQDQPAASQQQQQQQQQQHDTVDQLAARLRQGLLCWPAQHVKLLRAVVGLVQSKQPASSEQAAPAVWELRGTLWQGCSLATLEQLADAAAAELVGTAAAPHTPAGSASADAAVQAALTLQVRRDDVAACRSPWAPVDLTPVAGVHQPKLAHATQKALNAAAKAAAAADALAVAIQQGPAGAGDAAGAADVRAAGQAAAAAAAAAAGGQEQRQQQNSSDGASLPGDGNGASLDDSGAHCEQDARNRLAAAAAAAAAAAGGHGAAGYRLPAPPRALDTRRQQQRVGHQVLPFEQPHAHQQQQQQQQQRASKKARAGEQQQHRSLAAAAKSRSAGTPSQGRSRAAAPQAAGQWQQREEPPQEGEPAPLTVDAAVRVLFDAHHQWGANAPARRAVVVDRLWSWLQHANQRTQLDVDYPFEQQQKQPGASGTGNERPWSRRPLQGVGRPLLAACQGPLMTQRLGVERIT